MANMKLVVPELTQLEESGFDKNDIFQRKKFGESLKNLVQNSGGAITIGLESGWGNGKTTFIKMWQGQIKNDIQSIYFDAFANDYQKEPFLALASEIYRLIPSKERKEFKGKVCDVLKSTVRGGLKMGVNALSGGIINEGVVDSAEKNISKLLAGRFDEIISDRFDNVNEDKQAMLDFRGFLQTMAAAQDKPIVFVIDELDRCRPDFALEFLEQIKHLFSVQGITFLLVINKTQLEESIRCKYGNINASEYLQKFVGLWLRLPRTAGKSGDDGRKYMRHTLKAMLGGDINTGGFFETEKALLDMIESLQPSFREIEQILRCFVIVNNTHSSGVDDTYQIFLAFVCCLKVCKPDLLEKIITDNIDADKLFRDLKMDNLKTLKMVIKLGLADRIGREKMLKTEEYQNFTGFSFYDSEPYIQICYNWVAMLG